MAKLTTKNIADDAVTAAKINSDVAGSGITQAAGGELDVNVDDSTIEVSGDTVQVKDLGISTGKIAATSVTAAKLGADVAGDGLTGGSGADLDVEPDTTGGANLARAINVSGNGVAVKTDDSTIDEDGSQRLRVVPDGIGPTQIDETSAYTWSGSHDFTGGTVSVPTPSSDTHAVTKAYADALRQGLRIKDNVRALADSNQTLSGLPGTIDGVGSWSANDRIILNGQTSADENGIWEVQTTAWTRPSDFDTGDGASGSEVWVDTGTTYGDTRWTCTTNAPSDIIDTNDLSFTNTTGTSADGGVGLTKTGNTINVGDGSTGDINGINRTADQISAAVDDTTIEIASNVLAVKDLGVATGKLAATSVTAAKLGSDVAGNGLTGGSGSAVAALDDPTGGANLSKSVNVSANGLAVKIDDSTIGEDGSSRLQVKSGGITETQLNASVAGDGISGGGGSALDLDIDGMTSEATIANDDTLAIYDTSGTVHRKITRSNFLAGVGTGETIYQEAHLITSGETTSGYFTLTQTPSSVSNVSAFIVNGIPQVNKQIVGSTGATPDFDILSTNQFHFNNNGAATGLSEHMTTGDVIIIKYAY